MNQLLARILSRVGMWMVRKAWVLTGHGVPDYMVIAAPMRTNFEPGMGVTISTDDGERRPDGRLN